VYVCSDCHRYGALARSRDFKQSYLVFFVGAGPPDKDPIVVCFCGRCYSIQLSEFVYRPIRWMASVISLWKRVHLKIPKVADKFELLYSNLIRKKLVRLKNIATDRETTLNRRECARELYNNMLVQLNTCDSPIRSTRRTQPTQNRVRKPTIITLTTNSYIQHQPPIGSLLIDPYATDPYAMATENGASAGSK
jgi:hypothetical protein